MNKAKEEMRKELEAAVAKFVAEGGKIEVVKPAKNKKEESRIGSVWSSGRKAVTLGKA
jgi:hypothetical protein